MNLHQQVAVYFGGLILVLLLIVALLVAPALEHWRWSRSRRGRGGRYVR